jgi:hypothetical protein
MLDLSSWAPEKVTVAEYRFWLTSGFASEGLLLTGLERVVLVVPPPHKLRLLLVANPARVVVGGSTAEDQWRDIPPHLAFETRVRGQLKP